MRIGNVALGIVGAVALTTTREGKGRGYWRNGVWIEF